jgi:phosphoribosylformylglycinamidine synthase subunit PurSL
MNSPFRIEIRPTIHDTREGAFLSKIKAAGFGAITKVQVADVYTVNREFTDEEKGKIASMLINPIIESATIGRPNAPEAFDVAVEIGLMPGVTDNLGTTVREATEDLFKIQFDRPEENVYSTRVLFLTGVNEEEAALIGMVFANPLINRHHTRSFNKFQEMKGMDVLVPKVDLHFEPKADKVSLEISDEELNEIGKKGIKDADGSFRGPLALRPSYMKVIQNYFKQQGREATDIEIEAVAQTWSEHCKHTIFADPIDEIEKGIFSHYIRRATKEIRAKKGDKDFCVSVFSDNSGGIIFDDDYVVTDKAETHNSPSALEPYGGAITGIVGVNRDALGYGMGAKPVINRYGFCLGDPDTVPALFRQTNGKNPALTPRNVMDGVISGVKDGGNESGIPSPQGFLCFDERYSGKPLVFAGTIGLIPRNVKGKPSGEKSARPGDLVVVAGGRVGMDGIHGATFSSEALNTGSPATAVQIGDPITQKKLSDVIVKELRDRGLYSSVTDCGAGGISCSIAEMAKECGGCEVDLEKVPLKYPNMAPWQIWISESQERMTFAVPPENIDELMDLMKRRDVEATVLGQFTDSGRCVVNYNKETIFDLDMDFLHDGLPEELQETVYEKPVNEEPDLDDLTDANDSLIALLKRKNITSYRFVSRQYDHEVQGGSVIKPLQGPGEVNGTASVTRPVLSSNKAVVASQGINPRYSDIDTYAMAAAGLDDAIAAAVAVGGDVDTMAIMDNFCWCSSDEAQRLGELKAAAQACYDIAVAYETPYISGKDSMFNDFKGFDENNEPKKVSIPPTVLGSAISVIPDATKANSMNFKMEGDLIYILGETKSELGGSEYFAHHDAIGMSVPRVDTTSAHERYRKMFQGSQRNLFQSVIHVDKGGLAVALAKSAIAGQLGAKVELKTELRNDEMLFSESKSRFLVSVHPSKKDEFEALFPSANELGVVEGRNLEISDCVNLTVEKLHDAYHSTFANY